MFDTDDVLKCRNCKSSYRINDYNQGRIYPWHFSKMKPQKKSFALSSKKLVKTLTKRLTLQLQGFELAFYQYYVLVFKVSSDNLC